MKHFLLLGAHISISGGIYNAFTRGEKLGCTAIQIFTKSNRQWAAKPFVKSDIELFKEAHKNSNIKSVIAHAGYLINIASPKTDIYKKSLASLQDELLRVDMLDLPALVFHPGSRQEMPLDEALQQVAATCDEIFKHVPGNSMLLLETMAGHGSSVGSSLEEIATILKFSKNKQRLGVCIDTCHIFSAGYDITTHKGYESFWHDFDEIIGLKKLKALHLNDSKSTLGSHIDRHEFIGKGKIGTQAFKYIMNDPKLFDIPKILETPVDEEKEYEKDLIFLKGLISLNTKKKLHL